MEWNNPWSIHAVDFVASSNTVSDASSRSRHELRASRLPLASSISKTSVPTDGPVPALGSDWPSLRTLEIDATRYVRASVVAAQNATKKALKDDVAFCSLGEDMDESTVFWRGNFVLIQWIDLPETHNETPPSRLRSGSECHSSQETVSKEATCKSKNPTSSSPRTNTNGMHLSLELYLDDKWSATVVLCYHTPFSTDALMVGFDFALVRGQTQPLQMLMAWLTLTTTTLNGTSCQWVESQPIALSTLELKEAASIWAVQGRQLQPPPPPSEPPSPLSNTPTAPVAAETRQRRNKPLNLTFTVPNTTTQHIDSIDLQVPVSSLEELCRYLETSFSRPATRKRNKKAKLTPPPRCAKIPRLSPLNEGCRLQTNSVVNANGETADETVTVDVAGDINSVPVMQALDLFLLREFAIDVTRLELVRVQTAVAIAGRDGRFQPTTAEALGAIQCLMQQRSKK